MMKTDFIKKTQILLLATCLGVSSIVCAQNQRILDLDEAISLGMSHNKALKLDSMNLQLADSKILQNKNAQLPQVSANLSYIRISDNITPFRVAFPTGDVVLNPQILNQSYNALQVRQLVWGGGRVKYGNQLAVLDKKAIYFDIQKNKADVAYNIATLWYNLFVVKQSNKIIKANLALLTNQQKDAENFVQQGILLGNDLLKLELVVTNLQANLLDIENTQNLLKYNLCVLTGLDTKTDVDVPDALPPVEQRNNAFEQYLDQALKNRPELNGLSVRKEQAVVGSRLARSNFLPTLSAGGSVNVDMPNQRVFPNQATLTGTWNVGIFLSWNLTDLYTNKEKVRESNLAFLKLNTVMDQAKEGIRLEVNGDYNNYLQAKRKIQLANKAVEQATENFRVEQNKFRSNTTTATEFLTANTLLIQSQINLTTVTANAELAYQKLLKSIN